MCSLKNLLYCFGGQLVIWQISLITEISLFLYKCFHRLILIGIQSSEKADSVQFRQLNACFCGRIDPWSSLLCQFLRQDLTAGVTYSGGLLVEGQTPIGIGLWLSPGLPGEKKATERSVAMSHIPMPYGGENKGKVSLIQACLNCGLAWPRRNLTPTKFLQHFYCESV